MFAIITQKGILNCHRDICPKEAEGMANSVDTDLIAPFGAVLLTDLFFMKTLIHYYKSCFYYRHVQTFYLRTKFFSSNIDVSFTKL